MVKNLSHFDNFVRKRSGTLFGQAFFLFFRRFFLSERDFHPHLVYNHFLKISPLKATARYQVWSIYVIRKAYLF